jgi:thiamine pyrophosphokinase
MSGETVHLFLNGRKPNPSVFLTRYRPGDILVAVDGGLNHLASLNLIPDLLIGDMDSIDESTLNHYTQMNVPLIRHPVEKDETDFELALAQVYDRTPGKVYVYAGLGGRLDHTLTNLGVASGLAFADPVVVFVDDSSELFFINGSCRVEGKPGDLVSLVPWGGAVTGVTTDQLQYPLNQETLYPDRSRGISNLMLADLASIHTSTGRLLCIHQKL